MSTRRWIVGGCITIWLGLAMAGMGMLMASTYTPSPAADATTNWPAGQTLCPAADRPTLVLCLHPRCPCSEATLDALETLLNTAPDKPAVYALLATPAHASTDWTDNELVRRLNTIPGVGVIQDTDGRASAAFGARTSGQTFAYDKTGSLAFVGGLTPGRGESGACEATAYLAAWLARPTPTADPFQSHVFGCALYRAPGVTR